jgi:RNA polymerase sigma-70 factor (ECF subfamily)
MKADLELVKETLEGRPQAFSELVKRHQKSLLRLSMRFAHDLNNAEDVVQETFIKAYQKLHLFEGRASFKSWLFQIAINTAKNRLRRLNLEVVNVDDVDFGVLAGAESRLMQGDLEEALQIEVERLPHRQRTALVLRIFEDLSFKEIAQVMECPYDTAKANYRHALMALRHRMEHNPNWTTWNEWSEDQMSVGKSFARVAELES